MSFKNPNTSQGSDDFHGLKDNTSEADYSVDGPDEKKDRKKEAKKFLFKKDSKDKGYSSLAGDANQDSVFLVNTKNSKKTKADVKKSSLNVFKKSFKDEKRLKDIKETKEEVKRNKKVKEAGKQKEHLFGNYLENAVASYMASDGVRVPYPIRICIDVIEQKGIENENIYRHHVNKSQLETICESINNDVMETRLDELNADPNMACAIIKKFLKELKSSLIPDDILNIIDKCESSDKEQKIEQLKKIIRKLPESNFETFAYLIMHFHRVLKKSDVNKIELSFIVQKFQPLFRIKERIFKFIVYHADSLFSDYRFKRYRVKTSDETMSRFSLLPESIEDLEQEIARQELYLSKLHSRIANEEHSNDKTVQEQLSEELWALQRYVTSLKRKVKKLKTERKLMEAEQIKNINETVTKYNIPQNKIKTEETNNEINNENVANEIAQKQSQEIPDKLQQQNQIVNEEQTTLDQTELANKEINLICENFVFIESLQQLLDKIVKEKQAIGELQQSLLNNVGSTNIVIPIPDTSMLTVQELYDNEQLILNENKLLEERINLINKRINVEKEKIFELKLNIKLKTLQNLTNEQQQQQQQQQTTNLIRKPLDLNLISKINSTLDKDLVMTKFSTNNKR